MRALLSRTRATALALLAVAAISVPAVVADAPGAGAALPPVSGCGFHLGAITNQGAAGTLFFMMALEPNSPAQRCVTAVTFTATATIAAQFSAQGPYRNITHNPLSATETVTFTPGRVPRRSGWRGAASTAPTPRLRAPCGSSSATRRPRPRSSPTRVTATGSHRRSPRSRRPPTARSASRDARRRGLPHRRPDRQHHGQGRRDAVHARDPSHCTLRRDPDRADRQRCVDRRRGGRSAGVRQRDAAR